MDKVYERTENGVTAIVSKREGLDEINHAQMAGKRDVRTMSSITRTDFAIEYKDGRKVRLVQVDAPETASETEDWASTATGNVEHRFGLDGRALCNRRYRAYDRPVSDTDRRVRRTRSEIENGEFGHLYTFCPACGAL
jgi:endonuclease YncB( thermonuclease family)